MKDAPLPPTAKGVTRRVLSNDPNLTIVAYDYAEVGAICPLQSHPYLLTTYVESGRFRFTIEGEDKEYAPGNSFVLPAGTTFSGVCIQTGTLMDCFKPIKDGGHS